MSGCRWYVKALKTEREMFTRRMILCNLVTPKRCDVDCGLGQECQWIDGEEMCVCSEESCRRENLLSTVVNQQSICASNNMTFESECAMAAWKCMHQQSALYKKYDGQCQSKRSSRSSMIFIVRCIARGL